MQQSEIEDELPISEINAQSQSFDFLHAEPEIYFLKDMKKSYV